MNFMEFSIVTISAFVGILNEVVKKIASSLGKDVNKFIPICSIVFGIILGISGFYIPNVEMGNNIIEAIFIGISAGAAATGCHQIYKQLQPEQLPPEAFEDVEVESDEVFEEDDEEK
jgi:Na+-translocating ferredoxin:NAD+ oxidoreductase RnfA subunit